MKSYTTINQSKELMKILPAETADAIWKAEYTTSMSSGDEEPKINVDYVLYLCAFTYYSGTGIPAWSLGALLEYLRSIDLFPDIEADGISVKMSVCYDEDHKGVLYSVNELTLIKACFELIKKLSENGIL